MTYAGGTEKEARDHALLRLSKNPWRAREGRSSLGLLIVPGGVYGGRGTIFAAENLIFQSKNRFLAVFAPGNLKDFSKNW